MDERIKIILDNLAPYRTVIEYDNARRLLYDLDVTLRSQAKALKAFQNIIDEYETKIEKTKKYIEKLKKANHFKVPGNGKYLDEILDILK